VRYGPARSGHTNPSMRLAVIVALAGALALVGGGCGGTETAGSGAGGIVPAGVPAFASVDTDPGSSQWQAVDELASKFPDKQKAVDAIRKELRKEGFEWEKDVKPALGPEVDLVWLDFAGGGENIVALLQPKDADSFARVVEKGNAKAKTPSDKAVYETYKGWTLMSDKQSLLDRFETMVDRATETLDQDPVFARALRSMPDDALVKAYVDGPKVMAELNRQVAPDQKRFVRQLGSLDWATASVAASSDGLAVDTTVHGTLGKRFGKGANTPAYDAKLPDVAPKDTLLYLTFHGTKNLLGGLQNTPALSSPELAPVMDVLGDIGTLFQGENALYVRPSSGSIPEVTLITEPKRGVSGRATLDRVIRRYAPDLGVQPRSGRVAGVPTSILSNGDLNIAYADVGGKLVVTDNRAAIANVQSPGKPLTSSDTYEDAVKTSKMPSKTHGFLYVDVRAGTGLVEKLSGTKLPAEVSRNLKPLRSAVEYAVSRQHQLSVRFFLRVK
jgi:Protein of unknown function (DUF3352)